MVLLEVGMVQGYDMVEGNQSCKLELEEGRGAMRP